jgi:hypothetical protein
MEQGDRYALWPAAFVDGAFSIPDEVLAGLWREMVATGRDKGLFYNGAVTDESGWIAWIKDPANYPVLVADTTRNRIVCVAWLNNAVDGAALVHFCMLGMPRPEIGKAVLRYWSRVSILHVLVGFTPDSNMAAVKYARSIGFVDAGYIPSMCNMIYKGRRVGAVVTTYLTKQKGG